MLSPEAQARIPGWKARKNGQWERIAFAMPGLQLVTSGEKGNRYMLVCSQTRGPDLDHDGCPGFYEGVLIGALPQLVHEFKRGRAGQQIKVEVPEEKKPIEKRAVDLSDDQIDEIVEGWKAGRSALELSFVLAVWGRDGKMLAAED
jgi:hypothetical protein